MYINRWMDKKVVLYTHTHTHTHTQNGVLLSHKKDLIWVSSSEVDEPKAYCTEWSKSEREKQKAYINAYIWNLEKLYWWTYLQGRNRDAVIEKRLIDTVKRKERVGRTERVALKYIRYHMWNRQLAGSSYVIQGAWPRALWWSKWWDRVRGGREAQEEGDICQLMADSHCRAAESNTTL